jgi:hypothetical protein
MTGGDSCASAQIVEVRMAGRIPLTTRRWVRQFEAALGEWAKDLG